MTAAAAPSLVGQHWSLVRGSWSIGLDWICSRVYTSLNWLYGLRLEWSWFTLAISAKSALSAPYLSMYSLPALPNSCAAPGALVTPRVCAIIAPVVPVGFSRSLKKVPRLPGNIFSKPITRMQSAAPWETAWRAMCRPVLPVEQLLLTL